MTSLSAAHKTLLTDYSRAVVHLRAQLSMKRFSIFFGAGLSKSFSLPDWPALVEHIAGDPEIDGQDILKRFSGKGSLPYKTELLFQHLRMRDASVAAPNALGSPEFENRTFAKWLQICKKHLYKNAPADFEGALLKHGYLLKYIPLIQEMPITITYNFDDFLERALFTKKHSKDNTLGYETVTNPWTQFRRRDAVIYHPHGILPRQLMEFPSDRLIFSESGYAALFLGALAGDFSFLLNHLSKNTCLIIGSSLEDEDLRNLLVQSTKANPGNPHYYVYYLKPGESLAPEEREAIQRANFHVYNLITLFLHEEEIAALGDLLNINNVPNCELADHLAELDKPGRFTFYLTGALTVGKSTATSQFRNLMVLDEWTEPRLDLLATSWDKLTDDQKKEVDAWIANQFRAKNDRLRHENFGVALVDRPPLDPLTFTPPTERPAKARLLSDAICPGGKWEIAEGTVIFLTADPKELAARVLATGRDDYTEDKLRQMEADLRVVYDGPGVRELDTRGRSIAEVARSVSEIIHLQQYEPFNFSARLKALK